MKKIYTLLTSLLIASLGFSQTELVNETLRSGSIPTGWSQTSVSFITSAGGYARFTATSSELTTDTFDASAHTSLELELSVAKFSTGTNGPLSIEYSTNNGTTWISAGNSSTPTNSSYVNDVITINDVSATMRIRFLRDQSLSQKRLRDIIISGLGTASTNDTDSEAYDSGSQPTATTISSLDDTAVEAVEVFDIDLEDLATVDALPTEVTNIRIIPHSTNNVSWTDHIQGVTVSDGSPVTVTSTVIDDSFIDIGFTSGDLTVATGTSKSITISVYLNTSDITDGGILSFAVDADNNGFTADASGSTFASDFLFGDFNSNDFTIDVDYTEIRFIEQPSNTQVSAAMAPAVTVAGTDENGNIDTAFNLDVDITSSGTLDTTPLMETAASGIATFSNVIHTATGSGLTLTASDGLVTDVVSTTFDITVATVCLIEQDFDTNTSWNYTNAIPFFDNGWGFGFYGIRDISASSPLDYSELSNNVLAENDINDIPDGTTGFARVTFDEIDISIYSDVVLTFDWDVEGYNANADDARYRLVYDGSNQPYVFLLDGNGAPEDGEGTVSINIPNTVDEVSLLIEVRNNGQSGYSAFDNFKLIGTPPAPVEYVFNNGWTPANPSGVVNQFDNISIVAGNATGAGNIVFGDINVNNFTISSGAGIDLRQDGSIKVHGTLNNAGNLVVRSSSTRYGSLIADNVTNTGQLIYRRTTNEYTGSGNNDLISAPFYGSTFGDFAQFQQNEDNLFADPTDNSVRLFGPFDKSSNGGEYLTYDEDVPAEAAVILTSGVGYRAATDSASTSGSVGILVFEGEMETGTVMKSIEISGTNSPEWNVIGNPYPSYITLAEFISTNSAAFDDDSAGVYGYNGAVSDKWTIWNQAFLDDGNEGALIAPGQGFVVSSENASGTITFNPSMRSFGNSDDFIVGRNTSTNNSSDIFHLKIRFNNNTDSSNTDFYFTPNASQGLDKGYDASVFGNNAPQFAIYSHLVQDNTNVDMAIQSLSDTDLANVTIPLGVNANQGEQLTFSISETTLPSTVNVYLDDAIANTSTLLNSSNYILTPNVNLNGTGRFYLRVADSALSTTYNTLNDVNIYTNEIDKTILIAGQLLESTNVKVYDLQGRLISTTKLDTSKRSQSIDVNHLSIGVYIVQLNSASQNISQKVIIR